MENHSASIHIEKHSPLPPVIEALTPIGVKRNNLADKLIKQALENEQIDKRTALLIKLTTLSSARTLN